jgi:hypothetical protein
MFEKLGRLAEAAASNIGESRRGFLGRLGKAALGAAGVLGGLSALSNTARAGNHNLYACNYGYKRFGRRCSYADCYNFTSCGGCPQIYCCALISKTIVGTC